MAQQTKAPLCKCGCGEKVFWDKWRKHWNIYLKGHHFRRMKFSFSEEHKRKISEDRKGKKHSEESKKKISEARKGKKHSEESKRRMSESAKGKKISKEQRRKISEILTGKTIEKRRRYKNMKLTPNQYVKFIMKKNIELLSDVYVKQLLRRGTVLRNRDFPDELVAAKREHLRLGRLLKGL